MLLSPLPLPLPPPAPVLAGVTTAPFSELAEPAGCQVPVRIFAGSYRYDEALQIMPDHPHCGRLRAGRLSGILCHGSGALLRRYGLEPGRADDTATGLAYARLCLRFTVCGLSSRILFKINWS